MLLLAKDGIYLPTAPRAVQQGVLASGNRADVLINCPAGNFTFKSINNAREESDARDYAINSTLLHISAVASPSAPPQCDLPVFEVNRPCCDWAHSNPLSGLPQCPRRLTPRVLASLVLWADLVDLRGQKVAKNLTFDIAGPKFFFGIANATEVPPGTEFSFNKASHEQYSAPVGEAVGFDLSNVNVHPFHIHINPFQLTQDTPERVNKANPWNHGWFQSGDWHDTLLTLESNSTLKDNGKQRVLMV